MKSTNDYSDEAKKETDNNSERKHIGFACRPGETACIPIYQDSKEFQDLQKVIEEELRKRGRLPKEK